MIAIKVTPANFMRKKQNSAMLDEIEDSVKLMLEKLDCVAKNLQSAASPQMVLYAETQAEDLCLVLKTIRESFLMQANTNQMFQKDVVQQMQKWNVLREMRANFNKTTAQQRPIYEKYMKTKAALESNPRELQKEIDLEVDKKEVVKKCPKFEEDFAQYQNSFVEELSKTFEEMAVKAKENAKITSETIVEIASKADTISMESTDPVLPQLEESLQRFEIELQIVEDSLAKLPPAPENPVNEYEEEDTHEFKID